MFFLRSLRRRVGLLARRFCLFYEVVYTCPGVEDERSELHVAADH